MTSFLDLPDEIISQILSLLDPHPRSWNPKPELYNMSLVSRRLSGLARPILLRDFRLDLQNENWGWYRAKLLYRSLFENPSLGDLARSATIVWMENGYLNEEKAKFANALLGGLPNLKWLELVAHTDTNLFYPNFLTRNPMWSLTSLTIRDTWIPMDTVAIYIFLPCIRALRFIGLHDTDPVKLPEKFSPGTSTLLSLDLSHGPNLPEESFRQMLEWPNGLQQLRCGFPGRGVYNLTLEDLSQMSTPMSPSTLAWALAPVGHSLESLELSTYDCNWPGHDGSRMDLSNMRYLKYIKCPADCFFPPGWPAIRRMGFYKLLPPVLKDLRLYFEFENGIIPNNQDNHESSNHDTLSRRPRVSDLGWLLELSDKKLTYTPYLDLLCLQEFSEDPDKPDPVPWEVPPEISTAMRVAEIQIIAHISREVWSIVQVDDPVHPETPWEEFEKPW